MTNEELQSAIISEISPLSPWAFRESQDEPNPFPISKRGVWQIARGVFEGREVGKYGVLKMKDYFNQLNNTKIGIMERPDEILTQELYDKIQQKIPDNGSFESRLLSMKVGKYYDWRFIDLAKQNVNDIY